MPSTACVRGSSPIYFNTQKEWQSHHAVVDGHSHSTSQEIVLGVDGPLVMVSVLSACGAVALEKNLMKLSVHQFGKKILKLMAQ